MSLEQFLTGLRLLLSDVLERQKQNENEVKELTLVRFRRGVICLTNASNLYKIMSTSQT